MGLTNAQFYQRGSFFWDERAATLEDQEPIQDEVEMGIFPYRSHQLRFWLLGSLVVLTI